MECFVPRHRVLALTSALVATVVLAGACGTSGGTRTATGPGEVAGQSGDVDLPTTAATAGGAPTADSAPTTWPLTGLELGEQSSDHPAMVVKVDNDPRARPQHGLTAADLVYEVEVEGITRFAAVFHSQDSLVGPVRSARSSDIDLAGNLNRPLFGWSGANPTVTAEMWDAQAAGKLLSLPHEAYGDQYWRDTDRAAPHNLYSDTGLLRGLTPDDSAAPPPVFDFRPADVAVVEGGAAVDGVSVAFRGDGRIANVEWVWDAARGGWTRFQTDLQHGDSNAVHADGSGELVSPENVVVMFVDYTVSAAGGGSPQAMTVGSGEALVLTDGQAIGARWNRPSVQDPIELSTLNGDPILLTAGRTWVELPLPGHAGWVTPERAAQLLGSS